MSVLGDELAIQLGRSAALSLPHDVATTRRHCFSKARPPVRAPRPTRAYYPHWERVSTRWADIDAYGHMNNARYFELIDTVVNNHLDRATGTDIRRLPAIGVVAEVGCRYFAEITYPEPVDLGVAVKRIGSSSIVYQIGLFQGDGEKASAEGSFVHVYVNNLDPARPVAPIPVEIRAAVQLLMPPA